MVRLSYKQGAKRQNKRYSNQRIIKNVNFHNISILITLKIRKREEVWLIKNIDNLGKGEESKKTILIFKIFVVFY